MIVNPHPEGWEIVSHYTHGLLAGKIAMQLKPGLRPNHWEDVLTAIVEHDDHLLDFGEKDYLTDAGAPMDFTLDERSDDDALEHAEKVYRSSLEKSRLVALLIGRHLEFLYHDKVKEHSGFRKFFKALEADRGEQLKLYGWKKPTLEEAYALMRFCDRCSLILCRDQVPGPPRKLEINTSIKGRAYFISRTDLGLQIDPWPFRSDSFRLRFEVRQVKKLSFRSNGELEEGIMATRPRLKEVIHGERFLRCPVKRKAALQYRLSAVRGVLS